MTIDLLIQPWVPGALLGAYCLVYGLAVGFLAPRKAARGLAYGLHYGLLGLCALMLVVAALLFALGKSSDSYMWYAIAGLSGLMVAAGLGVALKAFYR